MHTIPFSTTVSPTPVPTADLVFPPPMYNMPEGEAKLKLPNNFIWGAVNAAFQIEGALQSEGRGPSVVDSTGITNASTDGMVTDLQYFLYKQDIVRLAAMGMPYYSFSISWPRIVPFGVAGSPINEQGLAHYDDVINTCIEHGIAPFVTLVHFDVPARIDLTKANFSDHYVYYAQQVMARYGDRVSHWVTFNEPNVEVINFSPHTAQYTPATGSFVAWTHILEAHAAVYDWYKHTLKGTGQITTKIAHLLGLPADPKNASHVEAADYYNALNVETLANPLFLGKQYPESVLKVADTGLSALSEKQLASMKGRIDYFAVDPYDTVFISPPAEGLQACWKNSSNSLWPSCVESTNVQENNWLNGEGSESYVVIAPRYVRDQLGYIWNTFKPSAILISEFGFSPFRDYEKTVPAQRYDLDRTLYIQDFLHETLKAIHYDEINVIGALVWADVDSDAYGTYTWQWGLQGVNRSSEKLERYYRRSFFDLVDFYDTHMEKE